MADVTTLILIAPGASLQQIRKRADEHGSGSVLFLSGDSDDWVPPGYSVGSSTPADLLADNSEAMNEVVSAAERVTNLALDSIINTLNGTNIQRAIKAHRHAFFLEWRLRLIRDARRIGLWHAAAAAMDWNRLVLVFGDTSTANAIVPGLQAKYPDMPVETLVKGHPYDPTSSLHEEFPEDKSLARQSLDAYDRQICALPPLDLPRDNEPYLVLVCRWGLKTIPPTLVPLISALSETAKVLLLNRTAAGVTAADIDFSLPDGSRFQDSAYCIEASDMRVGMTIRDGDLIESICKSIASQISTVDTRFLRTADLAPSIKRSLPMFIRETLPGLYSQIQSFENFFSRRERSVVVACPGRTSEASIVEQAARSRNIGSIDVMNAYMSRGYTYTKPDADYSTSIDSWSTALLSNHFGYPEERILQIGAPRFDQVPIRNNSQGSGSIVIATQPSERAHMSRVISELAVLRTEEPLTFIVKLHPRESSDDEDAYRAAIGTNPGGNHFEFTRHRDIHEVLLDAQLLITLFSNVGIEAAIMDLPVIVAKLDYGPMPLPLDEFGIGVTAHTPDELREMVTSLLFSEDYRSHVERYRRKYLDENPAMDERSSAASLIEATVALLEGRIPGEKSNVTGNETNLNSGTKKS